MSATQVKMERPTVFKLNNKIKEFEAKNVELEEKLEDEIALSKEIEQNYLEAKEKLDIAVEALEFYANYENWIATANGKYKYEGIFFISRDSPYLQTENGKKAFEALSKIKSEGL